MVLAAGCGGAGEGSSAAVESASTGGASPTATIRTDVGSKAFVEFVVDPPTGAGFASPGLIITYRDTAGFFDRALGIDAQVVVHKSDGSVSRGTIGITDGFGTTAGRKEVDYDGVFIVGDTLIASIDLVFSNGGKRDPAGAKSYHVDFDRADSRCGVILRDVHAPDFSAPPAGSFYEWKGHVDVASSALDGGAVGVQWRGSLVGQPLATELVTKQVPGAPRGFQRFEFTLAHDTLPASGEDDTTLASFQLSAIPFVNLSDGTRIFDHNRVADGQSYVLWSGDRAGGLVPAPPNPSIGAGFNVASDPAACARPE
jgi:hypothetical protein